MNKIKEFKRAMDRYHQHAYYHHCGLVIASLIIVMQLVSVINLSLDFININFFSLFIILLSYLLTDFINGMTHMVMDNNVHYNSIMGPFIAAFHMHHKHPTYKTRHPIAVYFFESGAKFWLVGYLFFLILVQYTRPLSFNLHLLLVLIGIFSSCAEVSHYWCHNSHRNTLIARLQKYKILLSKEHHRYHHTQDNINYAFLNGMSDPLINWIAKRLYSGYKNHSDRHALAYQGQQTGNRG